MRIGRTVIISAILALSAAGSILSAAVPATTGAASTAHVQVAAVGAHPDFLYRG